MACSFFGAQSAPSTLTKEKNMSVNTKPRKAITAHSDNWIDHHSTTFTNIFATQGYAKGTIISYRSRASKFCAAMKKQGLSKIVASH